MLGGGCGCEWKGEGKRALGIVRGGEGLRQGECKKGRNGDKG